MIQQRKVLEYILLRRKNNLIDLGLAQYGCTPTTLRRVFERGTTGIRCAVLSNIFLIDQSLLGDTPAVDIPRIVSGGRRDELRSLALNPYLPDDYYLNLLNKEKYFSKLSEQDHQYMLVCLGDNQRLAAKYDNLFLDGYTDYKYNKVFSVAWQLTMTAPCTQEWAAILYRMLKKAISPVGFTELEQAIERWRIDAPGEEDDKYKIHSDSFYLRTRLADLLKDDENLLNASDVALRRSFYRRFRPAFFPNWPEFINKDGEDFVWETLGNIHLWKSQSERERLHQLTWDCPDPSSDMNMPNIYRYREKLYREQFPEWFQDEDDENSLEVGATIRRVEKYLKVIDEKVDNLSIANDSQPKKWWR